MFYVSLIVTTKQKPALESQKIKRGNWSIPLRKIKKEGSARG